MSLGPRPGGPGILGPGTAYTGQGGEPPRQRPGRGGGELPGQRRARRRLGKAGRQTGWVPCLRACWNLLPTLPPAVHFWVTERPPCFRAEVLALSRQHPTPDKGKRHCPCHPHGRSSVSVFLLQREGQTPPPGQKSWGFSLWGQGAARPPGSAREGSGQPLFCTKAASLGRVEAGGVQQRTQRSLCPGERCSPGATEHTVPLLFGAGRSPQRREQGVGTVLGKRDPGVLNLPALTQKRGH